MAVNMEATIRVDKQGRTVLPKDVRKAVGIDGEAEIVCRVVGNRIILEKFSMEAIHKAFAELEEMAPSLELDTVKVEGEDKYIDREYALRKIGVRGIS
jgi:AbrB family looped-hinge helix DNA binding protein